MGPKVLKKINAKLKFFHRKMRHLTPAFIRLLRNARIQPHFDYGCISWFSLFYKNFKNDFQKAQSKYTRFCLNLLLRSRINPSHIMKINWLLA